jgi:hypothetical protein
MKKIVCSLSTFNAGCTFVDWSINFLSGQNFYFSFAKNKWIPLVSNPLTKYNAHGHDRNHPLGLDAVTTMFEQAQQMPNSGLYSIYPFFTSSSPDLVKKISVDNPHDQKQLNDKIHKWQQDEFSTIFDLCTKHADVIFIHKDKTANWYHYVDHVRGDGSIPYAMNTEFFEFENTWDLRERMALDMRFVDPNEFNVEDTADFSKLHFRASASDLWCRGVDLFQHMMLYLDLPIDPVRWQKWIPVYHEWAQKPLAQMHFGDNFDDTVKCIVNGWYKALPEFTLEQEAMIQHALIYRHNLNLKTWQLEKFPRNTIELHKLLEPNIHALVHTYEELRNAKFY